jgi:hypothetical protein
MVIRRSEQREVETGLGQRTPNLASEASLRRIPFDPPKDINRFDTGKLFCLQRAAGNAAVNSIIQRYRGPDRECLLPVQQADADIEGAQTDAPSVNDGAAEAPAGLAGAQTVVPLSVPDPIEIAAEPQSGLGDYPTPDDGTKTGEPVVMAIPVQAIAANVQRDDDTPHPSADAQQQTTGAIAKPSGAAPPVPCSLQLAGIYRNINIWKKDSGKGWELDLGHEPNISVSVDLKGAVSTQSALTLINLQWLPPWKHQIELGLSGLIQTQLLPNLSEGFGGQLQAEQHLMPWFSITANVSLLASPAQFGQPGTLLVTGGIGALVHFDGFGTTK